MPTGFGGQSQQRWGDNTLNQNDYMRDVQMLDLSGKVCSTTDARRKGMVLLCFWRSDTPECEPVLLALQKIADGYKESGKVTVWTISQDSATEAEAYAARLGLKLPVLLDRDLYHSMTYGLTTVPTVYLADGGGTILRKFTGHKQDALQDVSNRVAAFAAVEPIDLSAPGVPVAAGH